MGRKIECTHLFLYLPLNEYQGNSSPVYTTDFTFIHLVFWVYYYLDEDPEDKIK